MTNSWVKPRNISIAPNKECLIIFSRKETLRTFLVLGFGKEYDWCNRIHIFLLEYLTKIASNYNTVSSADQPFGLIS